MEQPKIIGATNPVSPTPRGEAGVMVNRQHPTIWGLLWCPRCETFKKKSAFGQRRRPANWKYRRPGRPKKLFSSACNECTVKNKYYSPTTRAKKRAREKEYRKIPEVRRRLMKTYTQRTRDELRDGYIKKLLLKRPGVTREDITPDLIEINRQQIIMIRTLKQFKEWRKENESDCAVIHGQQREDVKVNAIP